SIQLHFECVMLKYLLGMIFYQSILESVILILVIHNPARFFISRDIEKPHFDAHGRFRAMDMTIALLGGVEGCLRLIHTYFVVFLDRGTL
ncbi:hypothetical protein ACJX0J_014252, partial [Zea mays]